MLMFMVNGVDRGRPESFESPGPGSVKENPSTTRERENDDVKYENKISGRIHPHNSPPAIRARNRQSKTSVAVLSLG